jgi:hypothetical protein
MTGRSVMPSSHPPSTMRSAKGIWPHRQKARLSAGFFRSIDMLFTKFSQNGAQIERTKGFDPIQRARHVRAFCCQTCSDIATRQKPYSKLYPRKFELPASKLLCPPPSEIDNGRQLQGPRVAWRESTKRGDTQPVMFSLLRHADWIKPMLPIRWAQDQAGPTSSHAELQ